MNCAVCWAAGVRKSKTMMAVIIRGGWSLCPRHAFVHSEMQFDHETGKERTRLIQEKAAGETEKT